MAQIGRPLTHQVHQDVQFFSRDLDIGHPFFRFTLFVRLAYELLFGKRRAV